MYYQINGIELYKLFLFFFVFSFLGWVLEVIYATIKKKKFVNRGFLYGPICPIYGYGGIALILLLHKLDNYFLIFLYGALITSAIEFLAGFILEKLYNTKWWDYSNRRFNLMGYITLSFSIIWGIASVVTILLYKPLNGLFNKMPENLSLSLIVFLETLHWTDTVITFIDLSRFKNKLKFFTKYPEKLIKGNSDKIGLAISNKVLYIMNGFEKRIIKAFPNMKSKYQETLNFFKKKNKDE